MDYDALVSTVATTVPTLECTQELEMIRNLSDLILRIKADPNGGRGVVDDFWPAIALNTQRVADAAMASAAAGGVPQKVGGEDAEWMRTSTPGQCLGALHW